MNRRGLLAGAAGLALAIGLEERGLACEVVERAHALAPVGGGIILHPNALRCLDRLGVGRAVRTAEGHAQRSGDPPAPRPQDRLCSQRS